MVLLVPRILLASYALLPLVPPLLETLAGAISRQMLLEKDATKAHCIRVAILCLKAPAEMPAGCQDPVSINPGFGLELPDQLVSQKKPEMWVFI